MRVTVAQFSNRDGSRDSIKELRRRQKGDELCCDGLASPTLFGRCARRGYAYKSTLPVGLFILSDMAVSNVQIVRRLSTVCKIAKCWGQITTRRARCCVVETGLNGRFGFWREIAVNFVTADPKDQRSTLVALKNADDRVP